MFKKKYLLTIGIITCLFLWWAVIGRTQSQAIGVSQFVGLAAQQGNFPLLMNALNSCSSNTAAAGIGTSPPGCGGDGTMSTAGALNYVGLLTFNIPYLINAAGTYDRQRSQSIGADAVGGGSSGNSSVSAFIFGLNTVGNWDRIKLAAPTGTTLSAAANPVGILAIAPHIFNTATNNYQPIVSANNLPDAFSGLNSWHFAPLVFNGTNFDRWRGQSISTQGPTILNAAPTVSAANTAATVTLTGAAGARVCIRSANIKATGAAATFTLTISDGATVVLDLGTQSATLNGPALTFSSSPLLCGSTGNTVTVNIGAGGAGAVTTTSVIGDRISST